MILVNEQIKASEVLLTGAKGEEIGVVPREEALERARKLKMDLVCTSLFSSPPPCKLVPRGTAKNAVSKPSGKEGNAKGKEAKAKELRLTPHIEEHDYDTKKRQAEKLLASGNAVQLVVKLSNAKEGVKAKELLERLSKELSPGGTRETGIQVSGKQAAVKIVPR
ncbi:translation initiation factor IF-3 [Cohnella zeiphila]|uniref:Translation initiation factor IF-3 n=1 Tax=Cohnella zeiphila TaxID=2761120 RepID=A0A7X0SKW2_9BACL|nr:translation initiation factor IF-3 [Cohnella zeiphila]MBB6731771.1 translation initiation factor IF-3 [Cohnella zeiphila]